MRHLRNTRTSSRTEWRAWLRGALCLTFALTLVVPSSAAFAQEKTAYVMIGLADPRQVVENQALKAAQKSMKIDPFPPSSENPGQRGPISSQRARRVS